MAELEVTTISKVVDVKERTKRVSVPQSIPKKPILKYSSSHLHNKPNIHTIPEVEIRESDPKQPPKRSQSTRSHHSRNGVKNSRKYKSELTLNNNSYENNSNNEPQMAETDRVSKHSFDIRSNYSNGSVRTPSVRSLEVQREQYCCTPKWSPCERKLMAGVAVLATIILILVIAMGIYLGGQSEDSTNARGFKHFWKL